MASNKRKSLELFTYLCQKIGSDDIVKARRLLCTIGYIALDNNFPKISSGSKGEGLNFKDSDTDLMLIEPDYRVYEFESDVTDTDDADLIMNKDETPPCFTYLYFLSSYKVYPQLMFLQKDGKVLLSSELFKKHRLQRLIKTKPTLRYTHGPCITDDLEEYDIAYCIRCEKWISQAQPWISRSRTEWPPSDLISQITSLGVLFVPIGCKGSVYEHFEWRISFSVAEKLLIFSWNHTQLLCYALLKILLKEIIQQIGDLKDLLCSYFIKTLMFWLSEESDPSIWRPDNIIPCFKACLQKLLYSIEYSTLLHYFIPESKSKEKLITLLQNLYHQGIHFFSSSESLRDLSMFSCGVTKSIDRHLKLAEEIIQLFPLNKDRGHIRRLMYNFLHHSKSRLGKHIFSLFLSNAHQFVSQSTDGHHRSNNKQHYNEYKHGLSHLLVGLHSDALSGWLVLASFFNVHKNYLAALAVINHALSKCTNETFTLSNSHTLISDFDYNDKMKECVTKLIAISKP